MQEVLGFPLLITWPVTLVGPGNTWVGFLIPVRWFWL